MDIYIGNPGKLDQQEFMRKEGLKMFLSRWRDPKDFSYALDNGAYSAWVNGNEFDAEAFLKIVSKADECDRKPDFVICPDIVGAGVTSLEFSLQWLEDLPRDDYYLAVQDGMKVSDVEPHINKFKGLFVGGTMDWKLRSSARWIQLAHNHKKKCHIARVGTLPRLMWAKTLEADSVDSTTFIQRPGNLKRIEAFKMQSRLCFNGECKVSKGNICESCGINPFRGNEL